MKLTDLTRYGIPSALVNGWLQRQGAELLPIQREAIRQGIIQRGLGGYGSGERGVGGNSFERSGLAASDQAREQTQSVLISAPTSSGKSFCGELALASVLAERRKGALLVPLKSLAEEKFASLRPLYSRLGLRTIIATRDHPENDFALECGRFDIAVCVYEKFNRLLISNVDILAQLGVVVVDEIQMVTDSRRGRVLESVLTKILAYAEPPRIVGLSAVLGQAEELSRWLNCKLIRETSRPVELRQGVAYGGTYDYRSFNTGSEGSESFLPETADSTKSSQGVESASLAERLMAGLRADSTQKLVFLNSRRATVEAAFRLAAKASWSRASRALERMSGEEPSSITRSLCQTLAHGVAFHNSDLTPRQRRVVESAYRRGEVKVIFSTTTLAMGVNLPAETVYLEARKYSPGPVNGGGNGIRVRGRAAPAALIPVSQAEFENISGRAGRYLPQCANDSGSQFRAGDASRVGRAILLAESEFEREILWNTYIDAPPVKPPRSALTQASIADWALLALDWISSGLGSSREELKRLFKCALISSQRADSSEQLSRATDWLCESALVSERNHSLTPTPLGRMGALCGLSVPGILHFARLMDNGKPASELEWLAAALSCPDCDDEIAVSALGNFSPQIAESQLFIELPGEAEGVLRFLSLSGVGAGASARLRIFSALLLWKDGAAARSVEERTGLSVGQVAHFGAVAGWLVAALSAVSSARHSQSSMQKRDADADYPLDGLAWSVRMGLPSELRALRRASGGLLNRGELARLWRMGFDSVDGIVNAPETEILKALENSSLGSTSNTRTRLAALRARATNRRSSNQTPAEKPGKESEMHNTLTHSSEAESTFAIQRAPLARARAHGDPVRLEVKGELKGERFLLTLDGFSVWLTGKSFKYLARLAAARLTRPDGWLYKDDIEAGFNQARYLYRMRREITAGLPGSEWPVYENNRLGYYRLALDPSALEVDFERLLQSADYEIRQAAEWIRDSFGARQAS
ncbi:MAG: DEAD/DEAH box helicase [candidate division Zixibacteria bacterium]|nr:DEAD/DEAH box helicase [candidate division Zixibacteria bacterium]